MDAKTARLVPVKAIVEGSSDPAYRSVSRVKTVEMMMVMMTTGTEREAREKVEQKLPGKKSTLKRDEDVLDTCFSSALWPFSALGWPDKTSDLEYFPNTTLENRLGHYTVLGNVIEPVDVLDGISVADLHQGLLHGNLAPSEVNNAQKYQKKAFPQGIPQVGADALRFSLTSYVQPPGGDVNFDIKTMHGLPKIL
ncbi:hypothetical protein J3458_006992 [Metarhizium acridum]|uniref:uncharacterized protein n=1 Tax=Metarhizium acridum TaxID=92637 RepID=UPI001C6A8FD1|nr:hypothetical protein J3458_006992 [Metarhizium acridum]